MFRVSSIYFICIMLFITYSADLVRTHSNNRLEMIDV